MMKIAHLSAEVTPFAKTGGLGDVVGALPVSQAALGHEASVWMPLYREAREAFRKMEVPFEVATEPFDLMLGPDRIRVGIVKALLAPGVPLYCVGCDPLFDRPKLYAASPYGFDDGFVRYSLFVRAAMEAMRRMEAIPDILHAHDWHAALAPMALAWDRPRDWHFGKTRSVLTIHNLAYQGVYDETAFPFLNLPLEAKTEVTAGGAINFLKGGLAAADAITAVSPNYAWEITTPEGGFGLDGLVRSRRSDLHGIVNGIDTELWDPAKDRKIPFPYAPSDLAGKAENRRTLLTMAGMAVGDPGMVIGIIGRLVEQKGFDLLFPVLESLVTEGVRFVLLGSGEKNLERLATEAAERFKGRFWSYIGFDEPLAHLIEAGADAFLMPSRFEPCGLNQLYSLKYGTLPIVRGVGGLADTVEGYHGSNAESATGFSFEAPTPAALADVVRGAKGCFIDRALWRKLQQNGMAKDFSWARSAERYLEVYDSLFKNRR